MEIIRIKIRGDFQQGLPVTLLASHLPHKDIEGYLSAIPVELQTSFQDWQSDYRALDDVRSCIAPEPGTRMRLTPKSVTIVSFEDRTTTVKESLNKWLNSASSEWQPIRDSLISLANRQHQATNEETHIILDVKDIALSRLPWQEWDLLEKFYPDAEVALCAPKTLPSELEKKILPPASSKPRILIVVGRSDGINTTSDLQVIQRLEEKGAEVVCLMQPKLEDLCEALWDEQGYHIFVFTGHSGSRKDGQIGWIEVNNQESLSIEKFKEAIKQAIKRGLQLAIFNSCDGLGLANQFAELGLNQCIVMREPVPDEVAIEFFKNFFKEFTKNQSLYTAVHLARKRLESFNIKYPGALWLPILYLKPSAKLLLWQDLFTQEKSNIQPEKPIKNLQLQTLPERKNFKLLLLASLLGFAMGITTQIVYTPICTYLSLCSPKIQAKEQTKFLSIAKVPQGTWLYGGSTTWAPIRGEVDNIIMQEFPLFKLIPTQHATLAPGSGTGIKMLLDGQLSFAQSSRPILDKEYDIAAQRNVTLEQIPVAIDAIAVAVNPKLNINSLTLEQIKDIYTGKITNWRTLGGPDLPIIPYSRPTNSGTTEFFIENVLGNQSFSKNVQFIDDTTTSLRKLSQNPGAIYFASASEIVPQCTVKPIAISRRLGSAYISPYKNEYIPPENCPQQRNQINTEAIQNGEYPLTRRLFVIIKRNGQVDEQAAETYVQFLLTDQGQNLIQKAGFVPIRSF